MQGVWFDHRRLTLLRDEAPSAYKDIHVVMRAQRDLTRVTRWVDGIHLKVRLEQDKVCLLVMIGVRADGSKELIALEDGHRESTESWLDLLRSAKRRGMRAPVLAVGDGALGFWVFEAMILGCEVVLKNTCSVEV